MLMKNCREVNLTKFLFKISPELYFPRRAKDLGDWMNQRLSPTQGNLQFGVQSLIIWTFSCIVTAVFPCESSSLSKGASRVWWLTPLGLAFGRGGAEADGSLSWRPT